MCCHPLQSRRTSSFRIRHVRIERIAIVCGVGEAFDVTAPLPRKSEIKQQNDISNVKQDVSDMKQLLQHVVTTEGTRTVAALEPIANERGAMSATVTQFDVEMSCVLPAPSTSESAPGPSSASAGTKRRHITAEHIPSSPPKRVCHVAQFARRAEDLHRKAEANGRKPVKQWKLPPATCAKDVYDQFCNEGEADTEGDRRPRVQSDSAAHAAFKACGAHVRTNLHDRQNIAEQVKLRVDRGMSVAEACLAVTRLLKPTAPLPTTRVCIKALAIKASQERKDVHLYAAYVSSLGPNPAEMSYEQYRLAGKKDDLEKSPGLKARYDLICQRYFDPKHSEYQATVEEVTRSMCKHKSIPR